LRLHERLDAALAQARQPLALACLRAERAGYAARQGQFDLARELIAQVQNAFSAHPHAAVSAWLALAEGWVAFYTNLSGMAQDRFRRALALSRAAGLRPLQALAAGWVAHACYLELAFEDMGQHAQEGVLYAQSDNHSALTRLGLTVGQAYLFVEDLPAAQTWLGLARQHAREEGDEVSLSALNHNLAWMQGLHALQQKVFGQEPTEHQARRALLASHSTAAYDRLIGSLALESWVPMMQATIHSARDEFPQAVALYDTHARQARQQGLGRMSAQFMADMAWCQLQLGEAGHARETAELAQLDLELDMHDDDRAVALRRLAQVWAGLNDARHSTMEARARLHWERHQALQAQAREVLSRLPGVPHGLGPVPAAGST
jgi:hypothetical protein